jgi:hypothetical protein
VNALLILVLALAILALPIAAFVWLRWGREWQEKHYLKGREEIRRGVRLREDD